MINSLILRKYSPKNMLKGEDFLEKVFTMPCFYPLLLFLHSYIMQLIPI